MASSGKNSAGLNSAPELAPVSMQARSSGCDHAYLMPAIALGLLTGVFVAIAATAPVLPVLFFGILGVGACSIWMVAAANTLVQLRAAPELRGRVMGAWTVALPGTIPITALLAGGAADLFGPRVAYATVGAVIAGVALLCWRAYSDPS